MPKVRAEEANRIREHYGECKGTPIVEYQDSEGKHWHCPICGYWRVSR